MKEPRDNDGYLTQVVVKMEQKNGTVNHMFARLPSLLDSLLHELQQQPEQLRKLAAAMVAACDTKGGE